MTKIYAILLTSDNEFQVYNGRCAWTKRGNAVNAFNNARPMFDKNTFEDYEVEGIYKIVELSEEYFRLQGLEG